MDESDVIRMGLCLRLFVVAHTHLHIQFSKSLEEPLSRRPQTVFVTLAPISKQ